jgi:hypothetical protein
VIANPPITCGKGVSKKKAVALETMDMHMVVTQRGFHHHGFGLLDLRVDMSFHTYNAT